MSETIPDLTRYPQSLPGGALSVGDRVGPYRLLRLIHEGAGGPVYEVEHAEQGNRCAMWMPDRDQGTALGSGGGLGAAFRSLREVSNPHLPAIVDLIETQPPGETSVVMELVSGRALSQLLAEEGSLSAERIVFILAQALDAARALQRVSLGRGIFAADQLLVTGAAGSEDYLRLSGFGLAQPADGDRRAEVRAFGTTLQLLLTGEPRTRSPDPLRRTLHAIARGCLEEQSSDRWSSIDELKEMFDALLCGETVDLTGLVDGFEEPMEAPRRRWWLVAAPVAAVVLVGGAMVLGRTGQGTAQVVSPPSVTTTRTAPPAATPPPAPAPTTLPAAEIPAQPDPPPSAPAKPAPATVLTAPVKSAAVDSPPAGSAAQAPAVRPEKEAPAAASSEASARALPKRPKAARPPGSSRPSRVLRREGTIDPFGN